MKKKMYYNMRIKTLKRNATNVLRKAHELMHSSLAVLDTKLHTLLRIKAELERELGEAELGSTGTLAHGDGVELCKAKLARADALINAKYEMLSAHEHAFELTKRVTLQIGEANVAR